VEQLSKELELRTQKKDKYKQKYLDEKQRAATLRDDHSREVGKLRKDLELARAQLDTQIDLPPAVVKYPEVPARRHVSSSASRPEVTPIVYPPIRTPQSPNMDGGAKPKMEGPTVFPRQLSHRGLGALEESITEDLTAGGPPLKPLPPPMEPTKFNRTKSQDSNGAEFKDKLRVELGLSAPMKPETCTSLNAARGRHRPARAMPGVDETDVVTRVDSDDENDGADRFHDASSDVPESMIKCFMCDHVFHSGDSAADRNAHVNEHLEQGGGDQETDMCYSCPVCNQKFPKDSWSKSTVELHINSHFTILENDQ